MNDPAGANARPTSLQSKCVGRCAKTALNCPPRPLRVSSARCRKRWAGRPLPAPLIHRTAALLDTRVVYCGDNLVQLAKLPDKCVDLIYIDPPFNSKRNYEVFWGARSNGDGVRS